ncbi:MAG: ribonuclease H [Candidatus Saccharibacteria bacterium]|nr:ribonuclease H [Candidatus Saccharibacteria bacterium]
MKILWTDGSAIPNPGAGGFVVIEELAGGEGKPVVLGCEKDSTNIRMEGKALIAAIKYAGEEGCEIHTDSEFWINVVTKWAPGWKMRGWRKSGGEIKNLDIVKELYELYEEYPVELVWVRGHVGTKLNEMADEWANKAREGAEL